ncbi:MULTISPECIES: Flp family type IVb pilin [unclassified Rhizobium]|uniref:Flp family type IVb pilin n=1 Tax=unclassified Rhizobium TaxID=2613769 RepID=UPI001ADCF45E|nr:MULTISPECIES: Flp family type IVb pilin [unclassified Rhizobium]MBO9125906.1 Flp family type IVb pilin [Rhizobium sp. 16-488-2b]MBO9176490.1 Flp family type IVb pilin [Rhizobium sp. 16-488-2a]
MTRLLKAFVTDRNGATAIEYGLIAALVATAIITGVGAVSGQLNNIFTIIANHIPSAT